MPCCDMKITRAESPGQFYIRAEMTANSRPNPAAILKDVVAFVDVWSSSKTDNYSKPFIQQLQDMGAEVSKTFNKNVTHVVFQNGHQATWNKAKKTGVRLVSVLWVARCKDDGEHVDEQLCEAINDDVNPALKKKVHRCMQPRDLPSLTPENDRRMKKKLDKMLKDLVPKSPLIKDVSPYFIDEENGIVYSPSLKRSEYMAQRLKEMRENRESLSPTDSQMVESRLSPELNPSENTPTRSFFQLIDDEPDCLNASFSDQPGHRSEKEDGVRQCKTTSEPQDNKGFQKSWMTPHSSGDMAIQQTLVQSSFTDSLAKNKQSRQGKESERTSIKSDCSKKQMPLDSVWPDDHPEGNESVQRLFTFDSPIAGKSRRTSSRCNLLQVTPPFRRSRSRQSLPELNSNLKMSHQSSLKVTKTKLKVSEQRNVSLSSITSSCTVTRDSLARADDDDNIFEDFFSPGNSPGRLKVPLLPVLPSASRIHLPLELEPQHSPLARKRGKMETTRFESTGAKKRKREVQSATERSGSASNRLNLNEPQQPNTEESSEDSVTKQTVSKKTRRQSTLPFSRVPTPSADELTSNKQEPSSDPTGLPKSTLTVFNKAAFKQRRSIGLPLHKDNEGQPRQSLEIVGRGAAYTPATGVTDTISDILRQPQRQVNVADKSMQRDPKTQRTLVMTSLSTEKQNTVTQVVRALGGFSVVDQVCESTTHVVSGGHRRTLNVLLGIARGCWILSFEWILWCLEQRQWIPEEPYELSDQFPAAPICRLQQHLSAGEHQQDLFLGQPAMFVSRETQPPTDSLVELIQLCGGTVCKTVRQAGLCIGEYHGKRPEGSRILSEQWVLDCITHLKQLPYENYDLE
ncbi:hypothetical protein UPYG_G00327270 [Umbra pygmaea]|uniref:BRCT domain-containing protein n=1 Tax=Umbra pygmaea TaxID=75934 RepID=A0ABD0W1J4_UMBPY